MWNYRGGAGPGDGDSGLKAQRVDMTKADLRRGGGPRVAAPNHSMYVFILFNFSWKFRSFLPHFFEFSALSEP